MTIFTLYISETSVHSVVKNVVSRIESVCKHEKFSGPTMRDARLLGNFSSDITGAENMPDNNHTPSVCAFILSVAYIYLESAMYNASSGLTISSPWKNFSTFSRQRKSSALTHTRTFYYFYFIVIVFPTRLSRSFEILCRGLVY